MEDSVYLSREDLYEEVWTTRVQRLAVKYGISDVVLGKICKNLSVPKPPRGYWARVAAGYTPKRTPLLKLRPGQRPGVYISPSHYETYKFEADASTQEFVKKVNESGITVPKALDQPHKLIRMARRHLRSHKPDKYGMVWPYDDCLNIRISKTSLDRGLILLNTIFRELEAVGFQIYISDRGTTVLEKDGTEMTITVSERSKRSENPPPLKDTWWHEKYFFAPSGELEIILGRWPIGESRWKDTAVRSVEMRIKDIIIGILESGDMVKREEARRAEEAEHERRLAQEYEERRRIEAEESQRKNELENQVAKWRKADQLRQFVSMAETVLRGHCVEEAAISSWVEWATNHANYIDPLTNGGILLEVQGNRLQPFG